MEPFYTGPNHDITLEAQLMKDIGWVLIPKGPVATAITYFDASPRGGGIEINARFESHHDHVTVPR